MRALLVVLLTVWATAAPAATKLFPERQPLCGQCHGTTGVSTTPDVPSLGGIAEDYALLQLVNFREGIRVNSTMGEMVKGMTDDDLRAAAAWVASLAPPPPLQGAGDPARMQRGQDLVARNRCGFCHGPKLRAPRSRRHRSPISARTICSNPCEPSRRRNGVGNQAAMIEVLQPLKDADLVELAYYLAHIR